jgi:hypothetical protein
MSPNHSGWVVANKVGGDHGEDVVNDQQHLAEWAATQSASAWGRLSIRDGEKGEVMADYLTQRVWVWDGEAPSASRWHLLVRRELDGTKLKFGLSNAKPRASLRRLAEMQGARQDRSSPDPESPRARDHAPTKTSRHAPHRRHHGQETQQRAAPAEPAARRQRPGGGKQRDGHHGEIEHAPRVAPESRTVGVKAQGDFDDEHRQNGAIEPDDHPAGRCHRAGRGFQAEQDGIEQDQRNDEVLHAWPLDPGAYPLASIVGREVGHVGVRAHFSDTPAGPGARAHAEAGTRPWRGDRVEKTASWPSPPPFRRDTPYPCLGDQQVTGDGGEARGHRQAG